MSDGLDREIVLDASALLAGLRGEPGADIVKKAIDDAAISAVNLSECVAKLLEAGMTLVDADDAIAPLGLQVVPFDRDQAMAAAELRQQTRSHGLSLGDRACLALAKTGEAALVLTADRSWAKLNLGVKIQVIR